MGDNATFYCIVTSEPTHTIQWLFTNPDNITISLFNNEKYVIVEESESISMLTVVDVDPSDDGDYTCDVENIYGDDSSTAVLTVICKSHDLSTLYIVHLNENSTPSLSISPSHSLHTHVATPVVTAITESPVFTEINTRIILTFQVTDDIPQVQISSNNWRLINEQGNYSIPGNFPNFLFSDQFNSLTIFDIGLSQAGTYTLTVTNMAGTDSASIEVHVGCKSHLSIP